MSQTIRLILAVALTGSLVTAIGCPAPPPPSARPAAQTPGQYFQEHQVSTMTPNGKIMMTSVEETGGKIQYKTEDGKQWRVTYSKRADGTYQYGTPEEAK